MRNGSVISISKPCFCGVDRWQFREVPRIPRGTTPADEETADHSPVKDNHDEDAEISVSLETLARHISETPRNELATLRDALDRQISSIEARLQASNHQPAIDATVTIIARVIAERIDRAQQRVETTATQALAANSMLRKALDNAQQQLESAQTAVAAAEADRTAIAAQHREVLNEKKKLAAALKHSQEETEELAVERLELQRRLKDVTAARAAAEMQYQQLVLASQKLNDGLSQTLQVNVSRPSDPAAPPKRSVSETLQNHAIEHHHVIEEHATNDSAGGEPGQRSKKTASILRTGTRCQARQGPPEYSRKRGWHPR